MLLLKKIFKITVIIFLLYYFQLQSAFACQYNLRETGFVDLGTEPYFIYLYVNQNTPENIISIFKRIAPDLFEDSNVRAEIVNVDFDKNHAVLKYLNEWQIKSLPTALLVSPDGQLKILPIKFLDKSFEQSLKTIIREIIFSPLRKQILTEVINTFGVVLLVEGENENENERAKNAVEKAIKNICLKMELMPKPIKNSPVLITLRPQLFSSERILLWSLGLNSEEIEQPVAAVIYGRARWIGPLFIGEKIISENLSSILLTIGMDCECGLDKSWMQGTMLPVRWDKNLQSRVAKSLGFDPENPMVKMEINRILRMGSSHPGVPMNIINGYLKPDSSKQNIGEFPSKDNILESSKNVNSTVQSENSILGKSLLIIVGLSIFILVGGVIIYFRATQRSV